MKRIKYPLIIWLVVISVVVMTYLIFVRITSDTTPLMSSKISIEDLRSAHKSIIIDGDKYKIEAYLWRDFMPGPGSSADGSSLMVHIRVVSGGEAAITSKIDITRLWVVNGEKIWETEFTDEERPPTADNILEKMGRNGPKWGPDIAVDVIVKVIDLKSGQEYLLKAPNQDINATS